MSKRSVAFALGLALAAGLAACATPTPYQPNVPGQQTSGGYSELRLEQNRFRVTFTGNSLTSRETVEAYLLFRAAELTTQQGYDWFSIVDRHTDRDARILSRGCAHRDQHHRGARYWDDNKAGHCRRHDSGIRWLHRSGPRR